MKRRNNSNYVVEEQSRGVGAVASRDLGIASRASGGEIIARERSTGGFPSKSFTHRVGVGLPQPAKTITAVAKVPVQHFAVDNYSGPAYRKNNVNLVVRPGGAKVHAGVILGNPPPAVVALDRQIAAKQGAFSRVHTPRSTLSDFDPVATFQAMPTASDPKLRVDPARVAVTAPKRQLPIAVETPESIAKRQAQEKAYAAVRQAYDQAAGTEAGLAKKGAPAGARAVSLYGGELVITGVLQNGYVHQATLRVKRNARRAKRNARETTVVEEWSIASVPFLPPPLSVVKERNAKFDRIKYQRAFHRACARAYPKGEERTKQDNCAEALRAPSPSPYGSNWKAVAEARLLAFNVDLHWRDRAKVENMDAALNYIKNSATPPETGREHTAVATMKTCDELPDGAIYSIVDHRPDGTMTNIRYMCVDGVAVAIGKGTDKKPRGEEKEKILKDIVEQSPEAVAARNLLIAAGAVGAGVALFFLLRRK